MKRRLSWLAGLVLLGIAAALVAGTRTAWRERETAQAEQDQATAIMQEARSAGAARWAPDALARTERAVRDALVIMRAEDARLPFLASFPSATSAWASANEAAQEALDRAVAGERGAREKAEQAIAGAETLVSAVAAASTSMRLQADSRQLLARAQLALAESRILHGQKDYVRAAERADWAAGAGGRLNDEVLAATGRYSEAELVATWSRWKAQLVAQSRTERQPAILVEKAEHRLTLYQDGVAVRTYDVELGPNWISAKTRSGDAATPEGQYRIVARKGPGESAYHRALLLDYPNARDRQVFARERQRGQLPSAASLGGLIEIHGSGGRGEDWTRGCVAMPDAAIDDLFDRVHVGTPVTIVGGNRQRLNERIGQPDGDRPSTGRNP